MSSSRPETDHVASLLLLYLFALCILTSIFGFMSKWEDTLMQIVASYVDRLDFSDHHVFQARVQLSSSLL